MQKKYWIYGAVILGVLVLASQWWVSRPATEVVESTAVVTSDIIYFYGQECTHCQEVAKFIADNKIDKKVAFVKKEVWNNKTNQAEMTAKIKECNIPESQAGVPFLYARGKCYIGSPDVEQFFKQEAGIQ